MLDVIQTTASVVLAIGVIIAFWQAIMFFNDSKDSNKRQKAIKAIELAGFFKDNIIPKTNTLDKIFHALDIVEHLSSIDESKAEDFDHDELLRMFAKEKIEKIIFCLDPQNCKNKNYLLHLVDQCSDKINLKQNIVLVQTAPPDNAPPPKGIVPKDTVQKVSDADLLKISSFIGGIINDILNDMEYFSMYFVSKAADKDTVFPSLHQVFLYNTKMLYYFVANSNKNAANKAYTNIIALYDEWNKKQLENRAKERAAKRDINSPPPALK